MVLDKKIRELINKKREIALDCKNKKITDQKEYEIREKLDLELLELNKQKIQEILKEYEEKQLKIKENEKKIDKDLYLAKKQNKPQIITTDKKININQTTTQLILKALEHPKINNEEKAVIMIKTWKPKIIEQDLRRQLKNIISIIKNKEKKQFSEYTWIDEEYKIVKKTQLTL